ncbi:MAG: ParB/RepB/Spo0J family partition protein [bacterium]
MANLANRRGLGKGLNAIIPKSSVFVGGRTIVNLDVNRVVPNPRQPRTTFNTESLQDLANSIAVQGVIEPILVRQVGNQYELVAGERRLRAAKLAKQVTIPAIIKSFTDEQSMELALIENLQREDLNPMDEAEGYARLMAEFKQTQEDVAKKVGKSRSTVANMLRLLKLPQQITDSLKKEEITMGHARAILAVEGEQKQLEVWQQIVKGGFNVRDVEVLAGQASTRPKRLSRKRSPTHNAELSALVEKLTSYLGTKVKIFGSEERGRIEINYFSKEDLERILETIGALKN